MTAPTMTRDPDLDKAIDDLELTAKALRWAEERLRKPLSDLSLEEVGRLEFERDECRSAVRLRASTLRLPWRTLLLFVEQTEAFREKHKRRPSAQQMAVAIETIRTFTERAALETDATIALMKIRSLVANDTAAAACDGLAHMAACR